MSFAEWSINRISWATIHGVQEKAENSRSGQKAITRTKFVELCACARYSRKDSTSDKGIHLETLSPFTASGGQMRRKSEESKQEKHRSRERTSLGFRGGMEVDIIK